MKLFVFFGLITLSVFGNASQRLVILGDSLTEGLGVAKDQAYPALLEKKIKASGKDWIVVNAGVSGATTAGGASRLKWQLKSKVDLLIIELGANDGLRGLKIENTEKNLAEIIELAQQKKVKVVLAAMLIPPNYGKDYTQKFEKLYKELAQKYHVHLMPFLLDKVGGDSKFNQTDGIHPNEMGHQIVAENVYESIKELL